MMRDKLESKAQKRLLQYVHVHCQVLTAVPKQGMFNFRCFENAVQYAHDNENTAVIEVMLDDGGTPILHYINQDTVTGVYLETTQGYRAAHMDYYMLRVIHPSQYPYIGDVFIKAGDSWSKRFAGGFLNWLFNIGRIC